MIPHFMHLGQTSSMKTCFSPTKFAFKAGILEDALEVGVGIVRNFYGSIQQHRGGSRHSPDSHGRMSDFMAEKLSVINSRHHNICNVYFLI